MNPEHWQKIRRICEGALECEAGEREAFLVEACAGDDGLRKDVDSYLACGNEQGGFLENPALEIAAKAMAKDEAQRREPDYTGRTFLHYRIIEKIGAGGMGVVYKAHDAHLDRSVALKVLPPEAVTDLERKRRFIQEAKAASALNHPNIITIYDINEADGIDFIAMEYVAGKTLKQLIDEKDLPQAEVLKYAIQIADALAVAHKAGIVHRDMKPANVMVSDDGRVKVLDFGLAKLMQPQTPGGITATSPTESSTQKGAILGTAAYMSPEQCLGKNVDSRSDVFSFGSVLYEMVTGQRAFLGNNIISTMAAILEKAPKPLSEIAADVPPELEQTVGKCLEKEPENRFQSAQELAIDLRRMQASVLSRAQPAAGPAGWLSHKSVGLGLAASASVIVMLIALNVTGLRERLLGRAGAPRLTALVVLPLENLSGDREQESFADGMTDELTTSLAKISTLKVISRTSAMQYKDTKKHLPQIGKELNVDAVIEGSVLQAGNRVRITAQLIQASADRHLWAETYERDLRDVLALQSEVVSAIVEQVRAKLTPQEQGRLASTRPVNPEAYKAYFKGKYYTNKFTEDGFKKAVESFRQANDLDPTYAPAYEGLADVYCWRAMWGLQQSTEAFPLARKAASTALELDAGLADAYSALGQINFLFDWDWSGAEQEIKHAVMLNPNSSTAHFWYGVFLTAMGRSEEAVTETKKALELDPLTPTTNLELGWVFYYARRHDDSINQLKKTLGLAPDFGYANMELGWNYAQMRMYPEAVEQCQRAVTLMPMEQVTLSGCGNVYALAGKRQDALMLLDRLKNLSTRGYVDPYNVALIYDGLGDNDNVFKWLDRAFREHSASLYALRVEAWSDRLRTDPRFQELLRLMNFPK
jgi:serine/threonine protein kinase/tetratricopeptide (TPR) repeat protein